MERASCALLPIKAQVRGIPSVSPDAACVESDFSRFLWGFPPQHGELAVLPLYVQGPKNDAPQSGQWPPTLAPASRLLFGSCFGNRHGKRSFEPLPSNDGITS